VLLTKYPECAKALDKYRINPGNVGAGQRRDEQFSTICKIAVDNGKPVRIGVNGGSLNQELVMRKMQENTDKNLGKESEEIINDCMVLSALQSTELALESGLRHDQIIFRAKPHGRATHHRVPRSFREDRTAAAPGPHRSRDGHEGQSGRRHRWACCSMKALAIRFEFRLRPNRAATDAKKFTPRAKLLQALGLRSFAPSVTACPGLRPNHEHDVPGVGRGDSRLHPRQHAYLENAIRRR